MILPWHRALWERLMAQRAQQRLPHALLFAGPAGVGKLELAQALMGALVCLAPSADGQHCGACRSCRLLASGDKHWDVLQVAPEDGSKVITVDQIRAVAEFVTGGPQQAPTKVVLIAPAERMNVNAANSLLKTLEEPTPHTVLILVSASPSRMPATVRSRCQRYDVALPSGEVARAWLQTQLEPDAHVDVLLALSGGAPCAARELAATGALALRQKMFASFVEVWRGQVPVVDAAAVWCKQETEQMLIWLDAWLVDLARIKSGAAERQLQNPDLTGEMVSLAHDAELATLITMEMRTREALRHARGQVNAQLLWEDVLSMFTPRGARASA